MCSLSAICHVLSDILLITDSRDLPLCTYLVFWSTVCGIWPTGIWVVRSGGCNSYICHRHHHHQSILPKDRSFTTNSGTKAIVLLKCRSSTTSSEIQAAVLLGMDRWRGFPLLSTPHSLFKIWTDLKRSEKISGAPTWRWGEWIWLTGPSGLHQNSPQGLNISSIMVFGQIRDPEIQSSFVPCPTVEEGK